MIDLLYSEEVKHLDGVINRMFQTLPGFRKVRYDPTTGRISNIVTGVPRVALLHASDGTGCQNSGLWARIKKGKLQQVANEEITPVMEVKIDGFPRKVLFYR